MSEKIIFGNGQSLPITHEELNAEIERFKEKGGLIKQLPDAKTPVNNFVGEGYGVYDDISSLPRIKSGGRRPPIQY